jgi:hypothetical protein
MINHFLQLLARATAEVQDPYFHLPVAGREDTIYRERVYCYELYHQIRKLLEEDGQLAPYTLSGEIDKQAHPFIERQCAPDFVFHIPGGMDDQNFVVVEVKPITGTTDGIEKDLKTLTDFVSEEIGYKLGVELVYGGEKADLSRFVERIRAAGNNKLRLLWHPYPGARAARVQL